MATVIRIKRRLDDDPTESIVVRSKRARVEDGAPEDARVFPTILKRVATLKSKEEQLKPELLKVIEKEHKKGWELREQYNKLGRAEGFQETAKREAQEKTRKHRHMLHASYQRKNLDDGEESEGTESEEVKSGDITSAKRKRANSETTQPLLDVSTAAEGSGMKDLHRNETKDGAGAMTKDHIKYYDAEFSSEKKLQEDDVITCNDIPLECEKYVYDIYYAPDTVDWTQYTCEIQRYAYDSSDDGGDDGDDEDDENDEDNWRNDYPEEDDSSEDGDYYHGMTKKSFRYYDTDESYDADEYEEAAFDVGGNLLESSFNSATMRLRTHIAKLVLSSDSDDDII